MDAPLRIRALRTLLIALALMTAFVFFFVFPAHDPKPNELPIGVVGPPAGVERFTTELEARIDGSFDIRTVASPVEAKRQIEDRETYGAFVLGPRGPEQALVASAAGFPVVPVLEGIARGAPVTDVQPLDEDDPRGLVLNLTILPLVLTAILSALVAQQLVPDIPTGGRLLLVAAAGVLGGLLIMLVVRLLIGALPGSYLALSGVAALTIVSVALPSGGLLRLLGQAGTGAPFLLFLMLGNPASGAASAPELLPSPWAELGQFLQPGAAGTALRNVAYFDGASLGQPLLVLLAWSAIGLGLHALADRRRGIAAGAAATPAPAPAH